MDGSVRKRGNSWSYRIDLGTVEGKRKQKEKGGFKTQKDAKTAMKLKISEIITTGELKENKKITLQEVYEEFILYEAPITRKHSTILRYQSLYKNHLSKLGVKLIGDITSKELQIFISDKVASEGLSNDYVKSIYNFMLVLWKYAREKGYINNNNISSVKPPKEYRSADLKVYTFDEIKIIWGRINNSSNATAFMLAFKLGLRIGEIYGLRWLDIDLENNTIDITRQLQKQNKKWCFTTLKTPSSYRKIKFDNELKKYLLQVKNQQKVDSEFFGESYKSNKIVDKTVKNEPTLIVEDLINVKQDGQMLNTDSCKLITRICRDELNLNFKMHNLRHTHATMLLEKGLNPKYVSERLGHSKLEFTLRLYTHITRSMDEQAVEALNFSLN